MKSLLRIILLLIVAALGRAQPAPTAWDQALAAMTRNRGAEALQLLAEQERTLGRPTPRVESLKVYAYIALKDWQNARIALTRYLQLAGPSASSAAHQELLKLEPEIDRGLAEAEAQWRLKREQKDAAELQALAVQDTTERQNREAALRQAGAAVARLEQRQRTAPPERAEAEPAFHPDDITDEQIASLAGEPAELFGWLEVHGADPANANLADRLRQKLTGTELSAPLWLGNKILVGLARETSTRVFDTFPVEALAEIAGRPVAHDLYRAAGSWVLRPLPWNLPATARAHFLIRHQPDQAAELANRRAGHLLTGTVSGDGLWCASFVTLPLREARSDPWEKEPNADAAIVKHYGAFPQFDLLMVLNPRVKDRLVNLDWVNGLWVPVIYSPTYTANEKVSSLSPDFGFVVAKSVEQLLQELQTRKPAAVAKVVIGRDCCVALTTEGPAMPLEWLLVDSLADPMLNLLLESGRKIHLLADTTNAPR